MKTILALTFAMVYSFAVNAQWIKPTNGLPSDKVGFICAFNDVLFVKALNSTGGYTGTYWSFDNGDTWSYRSNNEPGYAFNNRLIRSGNPITISLDSGLTYFAANMFISNDQEIIENKRAESDNSNADKFTVFHDKLILINSLGNYYESADSGFNWIHHSLQNCYWVLSNNDSILYFITWYNGSTPGDIHSDIGYFDIFDQFQTIINDWSSAIVDAMFIENKLLFLTRGGHIIDNSINYNIPALFGTDVTMDPTHCVSYGDSMFVSVYDSYSIDPFSGVYVSNINDYYTWITYNDGFVSDPGEITQLFVHKNYLFAVAENGFFRRTLTPLVSNSENEKQKNIRIFPNPTANNLNVTVSESNLPAEITVNDIYGKICNEFIVNTAESRADISELPKGIYIVKIMSKTGVESYKILKE